MALEFAMPTPLDYFSALVQSDKDFALFEAAVSLAQDEYPDTDLQTVLAEMDQLLARVKRRLAADAPAIQKLQVLNRFFYGDLGFGGNLNNYYDPDNSFPSVLLRTRRGIPISLAVVWMELAQGLGLEVYGVSFPGHFLLKVNLPAGQAVLEPLSGRSLSAEQLSEMLDPYRQRSGMPAGMEMPLGLYLQPASEREILARMLRNLKEIYKSQDDPQRLLAVQDRLIVLLPQAWSEYRDRGLAHVALGQHAAALVDLVCYLDHAEHPEDGDAVAEQVRAIRQQLGPT